METKQVFAGAPVRGSLGPEGGCDRGDRNEWTLILLDMELPGLSKDWLWGARTGG